MYQFKGFSVLAGGMVLAALLALGGCATGVVQKDVDILKQQFAVKEQEVAAAKQQPAKEQEAAQKAKLTVWSAIPNSPPRPAPAPGSTPPPPPKPPAARTVPIAFYVDTITASPGESQYHVDASIGCMRTSAFKRGMHIVWRMQLVDTATGKVQQDADIEKAVLKLANGEQKTFRFGRHGATEDSPWFWTAAWDIPIDTPLGNIDYMIEATTKGGKVGTFKEMTVTRGSVTMASLMVVE